MAVGVKIVCGHQLSPLQFYEGTVAKLCQAFQAMGHPDALKVVERCLEEQHSSVQTLNVAGGRPVPQPRVRTAPGKDSVQWSCVPHTSCVSPSFNACRYCTCSSPCWILVNQDSMNRRILVCGNASMTVQECA